MFVNRFICFLRFNIKLFVYIQEHIHSFFMELCKMLTVVYVVLIKTREISNIPYSLLGEMFWGVPQLIVSQPELSFSKHSSVYFGILNLHQALVCYNQRKKIS